MPKNRIEALSDGVIAIIITLLVLEIKIPHILLAHEEFALLRAVLNDFPKFIAYALTFMVLSVWWVAHHQFFHSLRHADRKLMWLNNLFLFWICLLPYPTALIGSYPSTRTATILYGLVLTAVATTFSSMRWYASFKAKLFHKHIPDEILHQAFRKSIKSPIFHAVATILAFFCPYISLGIYAFLALYFTFPMKLDRYILDHHQDHHSL